MKLFTTAAAAVALMGVAAAAHADDQKDQRGHAAAVAHAPPPSRPAAPPQRSAPVGPSHAFNPGAASAQHFSAQPTYHSHPNWQAQGGPAGGQTQHFSGAQNGQHWNGQQQWQGQGGQHFNGQTAVQGGQQHFNSQAVQGGQQRWQGQGGQQHWQGQGGQQHWQGQANGQVQHWNGQGGQHWQGGNAGFGFQNHALRGRDEGRGYYSANVFARQYHAERRFRFGGYRNYPSGWGFRAWNYGDFLPYGWFGSQYYLDWADYGLPAPPIGCEWVAEGPDAVLVDVWTGEVLSVYRGVFYWSGY